MSQLSRFPPEFPFFHQAPVKQPFTTIEQQYHLKIAYYLARFYSSLLLKCWLSIHLQGNKNPVMSVKDWRQHLARVVVVVAVTNLGDPSEMCQKTLTYFTLTFLQRFLNSYSERVVAWETVKCTLAMRSENWRRSFSPAERASRSQGNNNGRQPSVLSASACCCRRWKVTDVAATAPRSLHHLR